jgi:hypothetical protein
MKTEQHWQRPHPSLAAKLHFEEISSLQISRSISLCPKSCSAERINVVRPLEKRSSYQKQETKTNKILVKCFKKK